MSDVPRREFLKTVGAGMGVLALGQVAAGCAKRPGTRKLPNVLLILADDMGYGDPGCFNPESKIPTPNIDRLASEGARFTNAHSPGAVCVPTRYGLMTGRFPLRKQREGGLRPIQPLIERDRMTLADLFRRAGYRTGCIGKWHLGFRDWTSIDYSKPLRGGPLDQGFDYFFGMHASLDIPPYFYIENDRCVEPPTEMIEENHSPGVTPIQGAFWRRGPIAPNFRHEEVLRVFTDKALQFVRSHSKEHSERPFFLYYAMTAPHTPWLPSEEFRGKSGAGDYGDFTVQVDAEVGRLLAALRDLGIEGSTLVIFTSDNGPVWFPQDVRRYGHSSSGPFRGMKADLWEGGHRMPFVARWPGKIPAGLVQDEVICFTDLFATFASLLGQKVPEGNAEDSFDILPLLLGQAKRLPDRNPVVIGDRAVIRGKWKFIEGSGQGGLSRRYGEGGKPAACPEEEGELYDLESDLGETKNLYRERPEIVRELRQVLEEVKRA